VGRAYTGAVPVTILLEGDVLARIHVRLSPLAELGAALHAALHTDHHRPVEVGWAEHRRAVVAFGPLFGAFRARFVFPLAVTPTAVTDIESELVGVSALPTELFVQQTAEAIGDSVRDVDYGRVFAHRDEQRKLVHRAGHLSPERLGLARRLVDDPEALRAEFAELVRALHRDWFADCWRRLVPVLTTDAAVRRADLARRGPAAVAGVSPLAADLAGPRRVVFDKFADRRADVATAPLVLLPSVHAAPHLIVKHDPGLPIVLQYPVHREPAVPLQDVHLRLAALHDDTRIRICRALIRSSRTTAGLAANLDLTQPQVSRHLRALREAGLVLTERQGPLVFYRLDETAVNRLGIDLLQALYR
jgi:DNA-binding transcriptional ArsR family regulator